MPVTPQSLVSPELVGLLAFLFLIYFAWELGLLPSGKRKPFHYESMGIPISIDTANEKGIKITATDYDPFRDIISCETTKFKAPVQFPSAFVPKPPNMAAYLAGDFKRIPIRIPTDTMGRHVPFTEGGFPALKQEEQLQAERRHGFLLNNRLNEYSGKVDDFFDRDFARLKQQAEIVQMMNASARDAADTSGRRK